MVAKMRSLLRFVLVLGPLVLMAARCPAQSGACCGPAGICTLSSQAACIGAFLGKGTTCTPNACDPVTGACCNPSGACTISTLALCKAADGVYFGDGSLCSDVACVQPTGACCNAGSHQCLNLDQGDCLSLGGTFYKAVACTAVGSCPLGACCLPEGVCTAGITEPGCIAWRGTFRGVGTTCVGVSCPMPLGACCSVTGACSLLPANICTLFGQWRGPGTLCPAACLPPGVCCRGSTCATGVAATDCVPQGAAGAVFISGTQACNISGSRSSPCCLADFNKLDGIDIQDIFDFLNAWFAQNSLANFGGQPGAALTIQNIFDFLNAWFVGGC